MSQAVPLRKNHLTRQTAKANSRLSRLGRDEWVAAARDVLIAGGVDRVKVEPLAAKLGVTTGSFYWHFRGRAQLLAAMLDDWCSQNSEPLFAAVARHPNDPIAAMRALVQVWIDELDYSPAWDSAVRDWARTDQRAEKTVRAVDTRRIGLLRKIFRQMGYPAPEAFIRARVSYFHQVGYYTLRIAETRQRRKQLLPLYLGVLAGVSTGPKPRKRAP